MIKKIYVTNEHDIEKLIDFLRKVTHYGTVHVTLQQFDNKYEEE